MIPIANLSKARENLLTHSQSLLYFRYNSLTHFVAFASASFIVKLNLNCCASNLIKSITMQAAKLEGILDARKVVSPITSSRGARFLDLVRQNKINVSPQLTKKNRSSVNESIARELKDREAYKTIKQEYEDREKNNYLQFSDVARFDPEASPNSSILSKRKSVADSSPLSFSSKVCYHSILLIFKKFLIIFDSFRENEWVS